jgi:3-methyladenine DNA glycosylase AlkD
MKRAWAVKWSWLDLGWPCVTLWRARAAAKARVIKAHRATILALSEGEKQELARLLMESRYGEQQSVAMFVLDQMREHFNPGTFGVIDGYLRCMHGWSKVDAFTGGLLADLLFRYPKPMIVLADEWNRDPDRWLRRASVVLFTPKVAASGAFTDVALEFCHNLAFDEEIMVQKGVGWALKDLMRSDPPRIVAYVAQLRAAPARPMSSHGMRCGVPLHDVTIDVH